MSPVHLGVAGALMHPTDARTHRDCVAGGLPAFPGTGPPTDAKTHVAAAAAGTRGTNLATLPPPCPLCARPTAAVLQVHAPRPGVPDRALYVFCCVSGGEDGCAARAEGWVALRAGAGSGGGTGAGGGAAAPPPPSAAAVEAPPPPPPAPAPPAPPAPVFGGGGGSSGGGWDDDGGSDDGGGGGGVAAGQVACCAPSASAPPLDLAALGAELAAAGAALADAQAGPRKPQQQRHHHHPGRAGGGPAPPPTTPSWALPPPPPPPPPPPAAHLLPAFWVGWEPEPAGLPRSTAAEDAHIAALLAAYRAEEGAVPEGGEGDAVGGGGGACTPGPSDEKAAAGMSWAGEAYEPDAAPGVDAAYLRFSRRIARQPAQVARYLDAGAEAGRGGGGRGGAGGGQGDVAWPAEGGPPPAPPCPLCRGPRSLELQLVAPLAAMFDEAAAWAREGHGGSGDAGPAGDARGSAAGGGAPAAWRWLTVGVWACGRADCGGAGGGGGWVAPEIVGLVNE